MALTVGSLFSGIGGFDLGLERAGMKVIWQLEKDPFCLEILKKHWPDVKKYKDIREVDLNELEPVDVLCGGPPCQPFSVAGKRKGKGDDRYLWPEMFQVIKTLRPRWVIVENVTGIVNMALEDICTDLETEDYEVQAFIIPACSVNAPHRRDRIWIIGNTKHYGQPSPKERASGAARNRNASGEEEVCKPEGSGGAWGIPSDHEIRWQLQQEGALEEQRGWLSNSYKQASSDTESTGTWLDKRRLWRLPEQTDQPDPAPDTHHPGNGAPGTGAYADGTETYERRKRLAQYKFSRYGEASSDTESEPGEPSFFGKPGEETKGKPGRGSVGNTAPDPYCPGLQTEGTAQQTTGAFEYGNMAEGGLYWKPTDTERWDTSWIPIAADFCRMDDGVSAGMDRSGRKNYRAKRLKALGNAVVPQIVEAIGRAILLADE